MILNHRIANPLICQHYVCIRNRRNALPSIRVNSEVPKGFFYNNKKDGFLYLFYSIFSLRTVSIKIELSEKKNQILKQFP